MLCITVLAAVVGLIAYGACDLGGSMTAVIFLAILSIGAMARAVQGYMLKGQ